ncbi:MAG TPA: tripartite tricarboxylate transporter TctB family protein [Ramlibacter sp.]|jgi:hypothetical protein
MEIEHDAEGVERRGVPTFAIEALVATLVLALGLLVIYGSRKLGSGWTSDGPGAGYFPFYIGLILCISAVGILYQSLFGKKRNTAIFVDSVQLKRVLTVFIPALVYVASIQLLGLYVASAIYITAFMIVLGKYSRVKSVLVSLAFITLFFLMFEVWFKVPLYKGILNPLGFLGY